MQDPHLLLFIALGMSLILGLLATYTTRALARSIGFVAKPRAERWHSRPTALAGGVGVFVAFLVPVLISGHAQWPFLLGCGAMFTLGLVDDIVHLKPYLKLIGQFVIAAATVVGGAVLPWTGSALCNQSVTVFWIIGITNALNLLDNMDGLAGGVAFLAAGLQACFFFLQHQVPEAVACCALAGALLGFLAFNWNPASIFMGDCGSLFIGYALATLAMQQSYGRSRGLLATIAAPTMVMLVPIFDTTFVTLTRIVRGRPVSQGGRDHTSHRLVTLGLSERGAVGALLALGGLGGGIALMARIGLRAGVWIGVPLLFLALVFVGIHLARTDRPEVASGRITLVSWFAAFAYKRRVFEVLLDVVLAMVSLVAAFLLRFDGQIPSDTGRDLAQVFALVMAAKLIALQVSGAYNGLWQYAGLRDLFRLLRGAGFATLSVLAIIALWLRFGALSRGAFIIDGLLFAMLLIASRMAFRMLRVVLGGPQQPSRTKVLLWGAGSRGEELARRLLDRPEEGFIPVGFLDDDPLKRGRRIHDLVVQGDSASAAACLESGVAEFVLLTTSRISQERVDKMSACLGRGKLRRARFVFEEVSVSMPPAERRSTRDVEVALET
jgi:UDP-GlcNAc:undecaprenyl-phosphate/decaprenyl-phosphate GlcNAc-1-phosphate transferase